MSMHTLDNQLTLVPSDSESLSLVTAEINVTSSSARSTVGTSDPRLADDVSFRHSGWKSIRAKIDTALVKSGATMSRIEAFRTCGQNAWVYEDPNNPGIYSVRCDMCRDRMCTPCQTARANTLRRNLAELMQGSETRFITFTLRARPGGLRPQLDRLIKSFRTLRNKAFWRDCTTAAASVIEITYNKTTGNYHPHIHVLQKGRYIPKTLLREAWHKITGDSYIVDIELVRDAKTAAGYLAKYVTKPVSNSIIQSPEALTECIEALHHRRLVTTLGAWRGEKLLEVECDVEWRPVQSLKMLRERASSGDAAALQLICRILEQTQCQSVINHQERPARGP